MTGTVWIKKQARLTIVKLHAQESTQTSSGKTRLWGTVEVAERKRTKRHMMKEFKRNYSRDFRFDATGHDKLYGRN